MRGRYAAYSPELAAKVVELTAQGLSLNEIARLDGMPASGTFLIWRQERPALEAAYLQACAARPGYRGPMWSGLPAHVTAPRKAARRTQRRGGGSRWLYTPELADRICERLMAGASMKELGEDRRLPATMTLYAWLGSNQEFKDKYAAACEIRAEALADEAGAIADDASNDLIPGPDGRLVPNHGAIHRARLMVDYRKWRCAKLNPTRYGLRPGPRTPEPEMSHEDALLELARDEDLARWAEEDRLAAEGGGEG
jgi:hypothetical protein